MKQKLNISFLLGVISLFFLPISSWISPIVIKDYKFFSSSTDIEFRIKGIAYYPRPNDGNLSLVNNYDFFTSKYKSRWLKDIAQFIKLGVNVVRIYSVDPSENHDEFMCELSKNGIYAFIGLSAPCLGCSIDVTADPPLCYPPHLYERAQIVYNAFAVYSNVLGFSVANEINMVGTKSAPCTKALIRDIQNYASSCSNVLRKVPIGIDNADVDDQLLGTREDWARYFNCLPSGAPNSRIDWLGWNTYVECDQSNTLYSQSIGFQQLLSAFSSISYSIPVVFGEYGCNAFTNNVIDGFSQQREWYQTLWMHETPMNDYFSGGIVFEYSTEKANNNAPYPFSQYNAQQFGLGYFSPENCDQHTIPCVYTPYPQFDKLAKKHKAIVESSIRRNSFNSISSRTQASTCPSRFNSSLIPATPSTATLYACSSVKPICNGISSIANINENGDSKANGNSRANSSSRVFDLNIYILLLLLVVTIILK